MKADEWKKLIIDYVESAQNGDDESLKMLCELLEEHDAAKQTLRQKGYGYTGMSLLRMVTELVPNYQE